MQGEQINQIKQNMAYSWLELLQQSDKISRQNVEIQVIYDRSFMFKKCSHFFAHPVFTVL